MKPSSSYTRTKIRAIHLEPPRLINEKSEIMNKSKKKKSLTNHQWKPIGWFLQSSYKSDKSSGDQSRFEKVRKTWFGPPEDESSPFVFI